MNKFLRKKAINICIFEKIKVSLQSIFKCDIVWHIAFVKVRYFAFMASTIKFRRHGDTEHAMIIGLNIGIWMSVKFFVETVQRNYSWLTVVSWLLLCFVIFKLYTAGLHYKFTECNREITFGKAWAQTVRIVFFASLVSALLKWVYLQWIDTGYLTWMYDTTMPMLERIMPDKIDEIDESFKAMLTPIRFTFYSIFYDNLWGCFIALLTAPFVVRHKFREDEFTNNNDPE